MYFVITVETHLEKKSCISFLQTFFQMQETLYLKSIPKTPFRNYTLAYFMVIITGTMILK